MTAALDHPLARTAHKVERVEVRPVSLADYQPLLDAAAGDDHVVVAPTHVAVKGGEIVGYASLGAILLVNTWVHSKKCNKFESIRLLRHAESLMTGRLVCMPCSHQSPFYPLMERFGYTRLGSASYNLKQL